MSGQRLTAIMAGDDRSAAAAVARAALAAAEPLYRAAVAARNATFDRRLRNAVKLPRPVISVGNLTAGGTGKTPMVIELAHRLLDMGARPAVLLRGYRSQHGAEHGGRGASDEAELYRRELAGKVRVEPDPNRKRAAGRALDADPRISLFLLDDGFQHRQVHRDLDLVLIDATRPFGFGRILPRGLLREPATALRRADAIVVTRADRLGPIELLRLDQQITDLAGRPPIAHAAHRWVGLRRHDEHRLPLEVLQGQRVVGFCGIGNPDAFAAALAEHVGELIDFHAFADHEAYDRPRALLGLIDRAAAAGAAALVTTEKDWVKLRTRLDWSAQPLSLYRPALRIEFIDGGPAVDDRLRRCLTVEPI